MLCQSYKFGLALSKDSGFPSKVEFGTPKLSFDRALVLCHS